MTHAHDHDHEDSQDSSIFNEEPQNTEFSCPTCGKISRDDVIFLCNTCEKDDLIHKDGIYMCPSCLAPGENFECMSCGSKEITMKVKKSSA